MGTSNKLTELQRMEIATRYLAGAYTIDLAKEFGVESQTIRHWLKIYGVPKRVGSKGVLTVAQKEKAVSRYISGESTITISRDLGVKPAAIAAIVRRRGYHVRSRTEACRRLPLNHRAFSVISDESAYWVGMLMADGCVSKRWGTISLSLKKSDIDHIKAFAEFVGSGHKIRYTPPNRNHDIIGTGRYGIEFNSLEIAADLGRFGVTPRKSLRERVSDLDDNPNFWRGMIDGDGSIGLRKPNPAGIRHPDVTLVGGIAILTQFLIFVLRHTPYGQVPNIHRSKKTPSLYRISIAGERAYALLGLLYTKTCVALERKRMIAMEIVANRQPTREHDWLSRDPTTGRIVPKSTMA